MPVNVPQSKPGFLGQALPIAGAVVGGVYGGPAGAAAGYGMGQTAAGVVAPPTQTQQIQSQENIGMPQAMSRKLGSMQDTPEFQLAQANAALKKLPPEYQDAYGPTLAAAQQRAQGA